MRFIKLAFISAIVLFGVIFLISLLLPSHVRISRAVDINAPEANVRSLLTDIKQWDKWNAFVNNYHNRIVEANIIKADEIAITITSKSDSLVTADWQQPSGYKFGSGFAIHSSNNAHSHVTVQWYFDFHVKWYPWEKFQSIVYDQQLGPIMETSLAKLKAIAESAQ